MSLSNCSSITEQARMNFESASESGTSRSPARLPYIGKTMSTFGLLQQVAENRKKRLH